MLSNCLSKVDHLSPKNSFDCNVDVAVRININGTLAAELKGTRSLKFNYLFEYIFFDF